MPRILADSFLQQATIQPIIDEVALTVKGAAAGLTTDLTEWQTSGGSILARVDQNGNFRSANTKGLYLDMASGSQGYMIGTAANQVDLRGGSSGIRVLNNAGSVANLSMTDAGVLTTIAGVNLGGDLTLSNPGIGSDRRFIFTKSNDQAWLSVAEWSSDTTIYTFGMGDNPVGSDAFRWYMYDFQGVGGDWEPLKISDYQLHLRGRTINVWGTEQIQGPYYAGGAAGGINGNQTSGQPNTMYTAVTGTLVLTPTVTAFTSGSVVYWVKIDGTGAPNTFQWGTGTVGSNIGASTVAITGAAQTLSNGVTISFSGTTGGVVADTWQFTVHAGGRLSVGGTPLANVGVTVYPQLTGNVGVAVRGAVGQTADLQQWQNSTPTTLAKVDASGLFTAPGYATTGLTGATAASRYVGATASGAPAAGTFAVGDYVIAQNGSIYVCTVAGTPGTWSSVGGAGGHTHDGSGGATSLIIGGTAEAGASLPVASSAGSIAIGDYANAGTGTQPIAIGTGVNATSAPSATGQGAIAIGASNDTAQAGARASGLCSIAIGSGTATQVGASASGTDSIALGRSSTASANDSVVMGVGATVSSVRGTALGRNATVSTGVEGVAVGGGVSATAAPAATAQGAIAVGASDLGSVAGAKASGANSIAIGSGDGTNAGAAASAADAIALGRLTTAAHARAVALGQGATTTAVDQIMLGAAGHQVYVPGTLRVPTGGAAGKVLTSDANGVASWQPSSFARTLSMMGA